MFWHDFSSFIGGVMFVLGVWGGRRLLRWYNDKRSKPFVVGCGFCNERFVGNDKDVLDMMAEGHLRWAHHEKFGDN